MATIKKSYLQNKSFKIFFYALILIALLFTSWKTFSYRYELTRNNLRIKKLQLTERIKNRIKTDDHIGAKPLFIFKDRKVSWKRLAPYLEKTYGKNVKKKVVGTFPVPSDFNGTDIQKINSDKKNIYFPSYGPFYIHTTIGFFKILLINPKDSDDEKILSICKFVSGNSVHSASDARKIEPIYGKGIFTEERILRTFFASDQPLKLWCGHISRFLAYVLDRSGYDVQLVRLFTKDVRAHQVTQVFLPQSNKYAMIDPDYGAVFQDSTDKYLSLQEIAIEYHKKSKAFRIVDITNKHWLKAIYNHEEPMEDFAWTPDKAWVKTIYKDYYLKLMNSYTYEYWIFSYRKSAKGEDTSFLKGKYKRDGTKLAK